MFDSLARLVPRRARAASMAAALAAMVGGCSTIGPDFAAPKALEAPGYRHVEPVAAVPADTADRKSVV